MSMCSIDGFWPENDMRALLRLCGPRLLSLVGQQRLKILPTLSHLSQLRRWAGNFAFLFGPRHRPIDLTSISAFRTLTHVEIWDGTEADGAVICPGLAALPCLTHVSLYDWGWHLELLFPPILAQCLQLQVLVSMQDPNAAEFMATNPPTTDVRFVVCITPKYRKDWELGARGGTDFWAAADNFAARKRRGEIEAAPTTTEHSQPDPRHAASYLLDHWLRSRVIRGVVNTLCQISSELIMSATSGIDVLPTNDLWITLAPKDSFPILKHIPTWFPGAGFKRQVREWRKLSQGLRVLPFLETKCQMKREAGIARSSFTTDSLSALEDSEGAFYEEHHVEATAGTAFLGGADTTASALGAWVLAMLAFSWVQKKAQAEVDSIAGGQAFEDKDSMPYISRAVKEVLRWRNVSPFGMLDPFGYYLAMLTYSLQAMPRLLATEDEYRGYRLPAGSLVFGNAWAILHDEAANSFQTTYPDPRDFKPEGWLLNGKLNPAVKDPESAFGFGRRLCPGRHMATSTIWIAVASLLAAFDITKAVDGEGNVIVPSHECVSGLVNTLLPFKCSIKPRWRKLVQAASNDAHRSDIPF
ncbi:cytochrome P450 [Mycena galopus ATCC 62051]|nr:cytochrome P450 [Mycena galopus ATCC 62051]